MLCINKIVGFLKALFAFFSALLSRSLCSLIAEVSQAKNLPLIFASPGETSARTEIVMPFGGFLLLKRDLVYGDF